MEIDEANKILKRHNLWRRGSEEHPEIEMIDPKLFGIATDIVTQFVDDVLAENGMAEK